MGKKSYPAAKRLLKLALKLALTVFFIVGGWYYVSQSKLLVNVRLVIEGETDVPNVVSLYVNKRLRPQRYKIQGPGPVEMSFHLPADGVNTLTLKPGENRGTLKVKRITIKNLLRSQTLEGERLREFFNYMHKTGEGELSEDGIFSLAVTGGGCWVAPGEPFFRRVTILRNDKTMYYAAVFGLGLLFFWFLCNFDNFDAPGPRSWRNWKQEARQSTAGVSIVFIFVFLFIAFVPFVSWFVNGPEPQDPAEKRVLARKPHFRWDEPFEFPRAFQAFYNDHVPFRTDLIRTNNWLKIKMLGVSPINRVRGGKEGWLFLDNQDPRPSSIDYYRSGELFTTGELEQWKNLLEQRHKWLKAKGIHYVFVMVPNKNTIYPEYMPDNVRKINKKSRWDQLKGYLEKHSDVRFVDLRPALLEAKKQRRVYSITDTHWNDYGAYVAHCEIIKRISRFFPGAEPLPLSRFEIYEDDSAGGDLAQMLLLQKETLRENKIKMKAIPPFKAFKGKKVKVKRLFVTTRSTEFPGAPLPRLLMVHDSFFKKLMPFLSEKFRRVTYIWDWNMNFYPKIINRQKPQIVIDELAERFLLSPVPKNPPQLMR